ncbi:hypothetical protein GpartN1_g6341.t1 [Galdieria partita]|uniref:AMP-activated protein kinase glycogen-binding domain-containing protein n=1 Tax=Galdieria partita TaxID=83374 RepID=A0A9C7Q286_9RHOD|nr:hypothetical protein GpartN1_g6341.t1 [Galdieria partita]
MKTKEKKGEQEETHTRSSESKEYNDNFDPGVSSLKDIPESLSGNKLHSSKKPPPPSFGTSWFGSFPESFIRLFGKKQSACSTQQRHNSIRRHSEPGHQASRENYPTMGKSTSYPEKIPRETATEENIDKEQTGTSLGAIQHITQEQKTVHKDDESQVNTAAESARYTVPTESSIKNFDSFDHSKSTTRGVTTSKSLDEFLNKKAKPRRHSDTEGRNSFDSADTRRHVSLSSGESTPSSSSSRSRSPSVIGNLSSKSGSKEPKFIFPVTGARQLRPQEISRHKYLECLKQKLVPTEFVYMKPAEQVLLMGDWLEWDAIPLQWDEENGFFRIVVDLPVGEHEFRYVVTPKQEVLGDHVNINDSSR